MKVGAAVVTGAIVASAIDVGAIVVDAMVDVMIEVLVDDGDSPPQAAIVSVTTIATDATHDETRDEIRPDTSRGYARVMTSSAPSPIHDSPTEWVRDHIRRYVESKGVDGHDWNGVPCCLLTTRGRRSDRWVRSALIYGRDGDSVVLVASKGGAPENPLWFENLHAHPEVWMQVGADEYWGRARVVDPVTEADLRSRLWSAMTRIWPAYDEYQAKAPHRIIPVVVVTKS